MAIFDDDISSTLVDTDPCVQFRSVRCLQAADYIPRDVQYLA